MKIAMLGHKRIPSREGGVEIVVEELAVRMAQMGHQVTVYNRSGHNVTGKENDNFTYKKKFIYKGVTVKTIHTSQMRNLNAILYALFATIRAGFSDCEVVHFHAEGSCAMIPLAKLFGKKCVATIHGLDWQRAKWSGFATKFLLLGEKMAVRYADTVIVLSQNVSDYFKTTYGRETVFIPNGIEQPIFWPPCVIKEQFGLEKDGYILFLARIVPEKGLHYLIEAYKKSGLTQKLVIAGGNSHSFEYEQSIDRMVEGNDSIIRTGFVQGRLLEELYSNCLFYVLPSEVEGMPISLLEAMSYGALTLVSDIPENLDVTGNNAMSFHSTDVTDLTEKLKETAAIAQNSNREERFRKENISQHVLTKFHWDDVVKRTLNCYENIICK